MASGCLCIVANTGGLREVVPGDETVGLRFPARDADALHVLLERVLEDDATRTRLVAEAREYVLAFDWAEVAGRTRSVYDSLAPQRATSSLTWCLIWLTFMVVILGTLIVNSLRDVGCPGLSTVQSFYGNLRRRCSGRPERRIVRCRSGSL